MDGVIIAESGFLIGRKGTKSRAMMPSNNFEMRNFLRDKVIVKWKIRSLGLVWHATRIFVEGGGLELNVEK